MGLGRRIVKKSARKVTRHVVPPSAAHPIYSSLPDPVRKATHAKYAIEHPVGAVENRAIGKALKSQPRAKREYTPVEYEESARPTLGQWFGLLKELISG